MTADPLPWGVVRVRGGGAARPAVRLGEEAVLLSVLAEEGRLGDDDELAWALGAPILNPLIELGPATWRALRERLAGLVQDGAIPQHARVALEDCAALMPIRVTDYADFYASQEHATNFGRIFRPGQPPLRENWRHLPIAYHGRASTVVVSGTDVRRPSGMLGPARFGPSQQLDLECELAYVCGPSATGPIAIDRAGEHIFGVAILNDWSARDIQRFEYEPLGPLNGKSFATSISAWITPLDALADARIAPPPQDPEPVSYLRAHEPWLLDARLEVEVGGEVLSRPDASRLYWTPAQMLAHLKVNGARLSAGDLVATGTISGAEPGTEGSLAEIGRGERWLYDGDEVVLRGSAGGVELAEVRGRVVA